MQTTQEEAVIPTTNEASSQESAAGLPAEEERKEQETNSFQVTAYAQKKGLEVIYISPDTAEVNVVSRPTP